MGRREREVCEWWVGERERGEGVEGRREREGCLGGGGERERGMGRWERRDRGVRKWGV